MENTEIESMLNKYRKGTASDAEKALLESWYLARDINGIAELNPQEFSEDLLLIREGLPISGAVRKLMPWRSIAAVAAVLALFVFGYLLMPATQERYIQTELAVLRVPVDERRQLTLPDGSRVWVNAGSELKYSEAFTGKTREVYLSGEAYFDIEHDTAKPFIIHTGEIITTVLGTAFNIREDKTNHTVAVTVTRGKVSVANGSKLLGLIERDQQISFNTIDLKIKQQKINADEVVAWKDLDLQFEDVTFAEAAKKLEARFGVKIEFANEKIKNCRFTGASHSGDDLDKVLKTICDFNNATYQSQPEGVIVINGPGCAN